MSKMKKFVALLVAAIMVLAVAAPAFAANTNGSITIKESGSGHEYDVYQLLKGTYDNGELKNIDWGANLASTGVTAAEEFASVDGNTKVVVSRTNKTVTIGSSTYTLTGTPKTITEASGTPKYSITGLEEGYYVVIDKVNSNVNGEDDAYSAGIVKVVGSVEVDPKSSTPSVDKQVSDEDDATGKNVYDETADHAINEVYSYKLTATLPNEAALDAYEYYYLQFVDKMGKGVSFDGITEVKVGDTVLTDQQYDLTFVPAGKTDGPLTFYVTIKDVKPFAPNNNLKGLVATVTYNAHLNEDAVIAGTESNNNEVTLKYSNDDEWDGQGEPTTGETGPDTVFVFTYKVDNKKVDGTTGDLLGGAEFRLYRAYDSNKNECSDEVALIFDSTLNAYRPVKSGETATQMVSANQTGLFNIVGVDAGVYYLKETLPPTGYNAIETPLTITIVATHNEKPDGASAEVDYTTKSTNINNTLENFNGATLPETGGIGTTIFYVCGAMMVLAASVLLVSKKRVAR